MREKIWPLMVGSLYVRENLMVGSLYVHSWHHLVILWAKLFVFAKLVIFCLEKIWPLMVGSLYVRSWHHISITCHPCYLAGKFFVSTKLVIFCGYFWPLMVGSLYVNLASDGSLYVRSWHHTAGRAPRF